MQSYANFIGGFLSVNGRALRVVGTLTAPAPIAIVLADGNLVQASRTDNGDLPGAIGGYGVSV
jgi:hypothetical protein